MNAAISGPGAECRARCQRYEVADMRQASAITGGSKGQAGRRGGRSLAGAAIDGDRAGEEIEFPRGPPSRPRVATCTVAVRG